MWISLSPKLVEIDFASDYESLSAIETIWASFFRGEHIVFSDRKTLGFLRDIGLSLASRASIGSVLARFSELKSLEQLQKFRVSVDPSIEQPCFLAPSTWQIPLKHFAKVALVPACILAENLRDATAYLNCATHALNICGPKGVKINLSKDSGGGAEISNKLLELEASRRQFILAITDTDKTYPKDDSCIPTKKCAEITTESNWVIHHKELNCSEIENILPVNLITDSIENSSAIHELSNRLDYLRKYVFNNSELHKWFDMKNGTKLFRIKTTNVNEREREHWEKSTTTIARAFECAPECSANDQCPKIKMKECECIFLPGLGDETLDRFNAHCSKITIQKQCERIRTSVNSKDWLELGSMIANWGVALERKRS
jgi:hypothetical protein